MNSMWTRNLMTTQERFACQSENGELDFSNGEVYDSGVKNIFEVREKANEDGNNHCNNLTRTFRQYQKWKENI